MLKAYRYRLYPTKAQTTRLNETLEICRKVYNNTLAFRRDAHDYDNTSLSYFDTIKELPKWKNEYQELKKVHSQVLQDVHLRVDLAFKAFFRRVKSGETPGYPRFKSVGRYDSITYPQLGFKIKNRSVVFSKIGEVKTVFHRALEGDVKTVNVRKTSTNKWFVSIVCENVPLHILPNSKKCVGIDVGLKTFATLSNGTHIKNPKFYQKEERELARVQRKGRKKVIARVHERIYNKRENFAQKLSRDLVNNYGTICFEDLDVNRMVKNPIYSKGILDAAWSKLVQYTVYKAEDAGRHVVLVDPRNTSQMCSNCGQIVSKDISVRIHNCNYCGFVTDRDLNASINIMRLGLQSL